MTNARISRTLAPVLLTLGALLLSAWARAQAGPSPPAEIPERLSDQGFWRLSTDLSEPDGVFQSDNLVSNEVWFQYVLRDLAGRAAPNGVYLGVGPEQNFTYIAALHPRAAFIVDIRRGNLRLHLLYKALFELSSDRAAFVSRLFSRPTAEPPDPEASARALFQSVARAEPSAKALKATSDAVLQLLAGKHHFRLRPDDVAAIRQALASFYRFGPDITYSSTAAQPTPMPTYARLMMETDGSNESSYLATEARFQVVKDLEARNLVIPVVGNFAGPRALRAVGAYIRVHGATVMAMYVSNVEQYLQQDHSWNAFCANVATMPLDAKSTFIRSSSVSNAASGVYGLLSYVSSMLDESRSCGK